MFETSHDHCVLPELWMVARLDGRSFTKLTKEKMNFEAPFDVRFRDAMLNTVEHLMTCGFNVLYGFTESDEISLLFSYNEDGFGRKLRKLNSVLAGEASAKFSLLLGEIACFDYESVAGFAAGIFFRQGEARKSVDRLRDSLCNSPPDRSFRRRRHFDQQHRLDIAAVSGLPDRLD